MSTLTAFKRLLFEGRSVLGPAHQVPGSERVNRYKFCKNGINKFILMLRKGVCPQEYIDD